MSSSKDADRSLGYLTRKHIEVKNKTPLPFKSPPSRFSVKLGRARRLRSVLQSKKSLIPPNSASIIFESERNLNNDPKQVLKRIALSLETIGSDEFTFGRGKMDLTDEAENEVENDWSTRIQNLNIDDDDDDVQPSTPHMYIVAGHEVDGGEVVVSDNKLSHLFPIWKKVKILKIITRECDVLAAYASFLWEEEDDEN